MGFSFKHAWNYKCPKCHQGDIFVQPFDIAKPVNMPDACAKCGQRTMPEPGFYYGAMFISYIFSGWFLLLPALLLVFYFKWSLGGAMALVIFVGAVCYLRILRTARSIWFHFIVKHNPKVEQQVIDMEKEKS